VDPPEKNRLPKATPVSAKLMYLRQSASRASGRRSLANPSVWRQWLAPLSNEIADQWKYLSALWSRSWPWKKAIADLVKHTPISWRPLFRPWGYAVTCLLIAFGIGYVQLQAPTLDSYPTFAVDSRPVDHVPVQRFKIETITITSEVEPYPQAIALQNLVGSSREGSHVSSPKNIKAEKTFNITEIFAHPDLRIIEDATDKEKNGQALLLSEATVITPENVKNDHQIQASNVSAVKQGTNQTKTPIPRPETSILTKQATATSTSLLPTEGARVTVKRMQSAVPKKTARRIKPNLATKVLSSAIQKGRIDSVRKALSDGADPNVVLSKDQTALTAAIDRDHFEIVQALLDQGATIDQPAPTGETALMKAAWAGYTAMTELLLNRGARVNLQNRDGWTPLFYASIMGRSDIVKTLLNRGAQWNLPDRDGRTPLMAAAWNGHMHIVRHLLSAGADPNWKDRDGWTPLMFASFKGHARVGEYLLSHGADLSLKNNSGRTSGNLATQQGHSELFAMISNHMEQ
jgi:ankyrin repeat protein